MPTLAELQTQREELQSQLDEVDTQIEEAEKAEMQAELEKYAIGNVYKVYGRKYTVLGYTEDGFKVLREDGTVMEYALSTIRMYSPELLGHVPVEDFSLMF